MSAEIKKFPNSSKNRDKNLSDVTLPQPFARSDNKNKGAQREIERISKKEGLLSVDEASILLENLKKKQEEIRRMVDEMYHTRGISPDELRKYISNPKNFTPQDWERIQKDRKSYLDLLNLPAKEMKEQADIVLAETTGENPNSLKSTNRRSSKSGLARRRGWLPMR